MKRTSRAHQILRNAGVIEEESDDTDVIENTPDANPKNCGGQASSTHLECNDERNLEGLDYLPLKHKQTCDVGETSIEAPAYSPLTPRQICYVGERSIEAQNFSPLPSTIYPTAGKRTDNPPISPLSSPIPAMSPATSKLFNTLIREQDSDDSVADPDYEVEYYNHFSDNSSDECGNSQKRNNKEKRMSNDSPSILTEELLRNSEERDEDKVENSSPRKRKVRDPSTWKINIEKHKRLKGEPYKTKKGKIMPGRPIKPAKCTTLPKHKCLSYVPEDDRLKIYTEFRNMASLQEQRHFVVNHVTKMKKNRDTTRGNSDDKFIRDHILSFPAVESHYCRRNSVIRYLDSALNITTMYRDYKKLCQNKSVKVVCFEKYRTIFRSYKLSFHKPKKDLCKQCIAYKEMNDEDKTKNKETYNLHLFRKTEARKCRDEDKEEAQNNNETLSLNFDLEAVLSTPKGATGPFFYVRKLAVYNLTIYNLGTQDVECYMWDETQGKRGSIEVSTCIYTYIMSLSNIKQVKMMSDSCGGQQKNYHFSSMCLLTVKEHATLQVIDHKFFETGHTHMECDSIHSKIEVKSKNIPVYTPDGWAQIVRLARTNPRPYNVTSLLHDDFKDFGSQNQFQCKVLNEGRKLGLSDAVWLQYRKEVTDTIYLKTSYDKNEPFVALQLKKKRGKAANVIYPIATYSHRLNISAKKKNDLLKLCTDLQIPRMYHSFYTDLPCSETVRDCLPEPDIAEDSE